MKRMPPALAVCAALLAMAGCADRAILPSAERPGSLGRLDAAYDRSEWRWVKGRDGRDILEHTAIRKCFVDPDPGSDFHEPDLRRKSERKTFGGAGYDVLNVYEGRDFWIAVYHRVGAPKPALGVYADGRCREAAERIIEAYEKKKGPA